MKSALLAPVKALAEAQELKTRGNALFTEDSNVAALSEYSNGIQLLQGVGTSHECIDFLLVLRSNRAASLLSLARGQPTHGKTVGASKQQICEWCNGVVTDCSAVLDMPLHAPPILTVKARLRRMEASLLLLTNSAPTSEATVERDASEIIGSSVASNVQKKAALEFQQQLRELKQATPADAQKPIAGLFLSASRLQQGGDAWSTAPNSCS